MEEQLLPSWERNFPEMWKVTERSLKGTLLCAHNRHQQNCYLLRATIAGALKVADFWMVSFDPGRENFNYETLWNEFVNFCMSWHSGHNGESKIGREQNRRRKRWGWTHRAPHQQGSRGFQQPETAEVTPRVSGNAALSGKELNMPKQPGSLKIFDLSDISRSVAKEKSHPVSVFPSMAFCSLFIENSGSTIPAVVLAPIYG